MQEKPHTIGTGIKFAKGILVIAASGILIGTVVSLVSNLLYLMLVFPFIMGLIGGIILALTIAINRMDGAALGILLGILMTATIYGSFHYMEYLTFRIQAVLAVDQELRAETGEDVPEMGPAFVDFMLKKETGYTGFAGYILYTAEQGITLSRKFGLRRIHLDTPFTWAYWVLELAMIGAMTIYMGKSAAGRPGTPRVGFQRK